jgi:hypothetical protein
MRIAAIVALLAIAVALLSGCTARLPMPQIREGRFDFSVTYELNGEEKTYSGVYVCKLSGVLTTLAGSSLEWEGYVENVEGEDVPVQTNEDGTVYINFGFLPEYFMGDPNAEMYDPPSPSLYMVYHNSTPDDLDITGDEDLIATYGVRLIDYEYAAPIENTFKEELSASRFEPSIN